MVLEADLEVLEGVESCPSCGKGGGRKRASPFSSTVRSDLALALSVSLRLASSKSLTSSQKGSPSKAYNCCRKKKATTVGHSERVRSGGGGSERRGIK